MKEKIISFLKKRWWYIILIIASSVYVFYYRNEIYQLTNLTAQNLIFILWLGLLIFPLFSEVEIGNVKLKKEIEQTRSEIKASTNELRLQIMELRISNSNTVVVNQPLATKSELLELEKNLENSNEDDLDQAFSNITDDSIFLFKVRLTLETLLISLCDKLDYTDRKSMQRMLQFLLINEVIDRNMAGLAQEIIKIANCAVHGEIVSEDYISFVKKTFPTVKRNLEIAKQYSSYYPSGKAKVTNTVTW